jgi:hypothetical protein
MATGPYLLGAKRPDHESDHSPSSWTKLKDKCSYTFHFPYVFMAWKSNTLNYSTFSLQGPWKRVSHSFLVTIAIGPVGLYLPSLSRNHFSPFHTATVPWWHPEPTHFDPAERGRMHSRHLRHRAQLRILNALDICNQYHWCDIEFL